MSQATRSVFFPDGRPTFELPGNGDGGSGVLELEDLAGSESRMDVLVNATTPDCQTQLMRADDV